ncbi:MAG: DUF5665 domain-containing protein [Thiolinea sp.]
MAKKSSKPALPKDQQHTADALENFVAYLSNPWRMMWVNFVAGVFRGLGAVIGASVVIAIMIWLLSLFVNIPLIGKYADRFGQEIQNYIDETNYNAEFDRLGDSLERIEEALANPDSTK